MESVQNAYQIYVRVVAVEKRKESKKKEDKRKEKFIISIPKHTREAKDLQISQPHGIDERR